MGRLLKWLIYLAILGFVLLVAYAYIGPLVGADFSADTREIRVPLRLSVN